MVINNKLVIMFSYKGRDYDCLINRERDIVYSGSCFWDTWLDTYDENGEVEDWPVFKLIGTVDNDNNPTTDNMYIIARDNGEDVECFTIEEGQIKILECE